MKPLHRLNFTGSSTPRVENVNLSKTAALSHEMQILKNKSILISRNKISEKFQNSSDLSELSTIRSNYDKQLVIIDSTLNLLIQGKLDNLKKSIDLIDESIIKLSHFSNTMINVNTKIMNTNTDISKFPYLKRVHNIRDNLTKVINQIEYFNQVPDKCKKLLVILNNLDLSNSTTQLKEIFLESIQLESLRVGLVLELKDNEVMLKSSVTKYLAPVTELVNSVIMKILLFIKGVDADFALSTALTPTGSSGSTGIQNRDFIDLAIVTPADLVGYVELVEMHQEYYERRLFQSMKSHHQLQQQQAHNEDGKRSDRATGSQDSDEEDEDDTASKLLMRAENSQTSNSSSSSSNNLWRVYQLRPKVLEVLISAMERRILNQFDSSLRQTIEQALATDNSKSQQQSKAKEVVAAAVNKGFDEDEELGGEGEDSADDDYKTIIKNNNKNMSKPPVRASNASSASAAAAALKSDHDKFQRASFQVSPILEAGSELLKLLVDIINDVVRVYVCVFILLQSVY